MRLLAISHNLINQYRSISSSTAGITKIGRETYARLYQVVVVLPDGSSINIRHPTPREIIKLPLDLTTLSEAERKARIDARKPRQKLRIEEDLKDNFQSKKYLKYVRK